MPENRERLFAIITGDFTPFGGMDFGNYALAKYLASRARAEVHLIGHRASEDLIGSPTVKFHRVPRLLKSNFLSAPLLDRVGRRVARAITERGGSVIVNGGNCRWRGICWVHYLHAAHPPEISRPGARAAYRRWTHRIYLSNERRNLLVSQKVVANSLRTKKDLSRFYHVDDDRVCTVYYGADPIRFHPVPSEEKRALRARLGWPQSGEIALFIGALGDRRKGFDRLFDAWAKLSSRGDWTVNLMVVGAGAELAMWKRKVLQGGLADKIRFLGFRRDIPDLINAADVLVHPARYEAYGLVVQEAICSGVPVIVSTQAGVAERLPAQTYDLVLQTEHEAELIEALRNWQQNRSHYLQAIERIRPSFSEYTWERMAEDFFRKVSTYAS